jgi:hypothetical protein
MFLSDLRPYPRLTPGQIARVVREVARYLALMDGYRFVAPKGEQLELFSSERLDV